MKSSDLDVTSQSEARFLITRTTTKRMTQRKAEEMKRSKIGKKVHRTALRR